MNSQDKQIKKEKTKKKDQDETNCYIPENIDDIDNLTYTSDNPTHETREIQIKGK